MSDERRGFSVTVVAVCLVAAAVILVVAVVVKLLGLSLRWAE